jgi:hypothetical protein
MDDFLLPQRMLLKKKDVFNELPNVYAAPSRSSVTKFRQKISQTKPDQRDKTSKVATTAQPLISIIDLISERMLLIERFLPSMELISLSRTNKRLNEFFRCLQFDCRLKLHHVANIIRSGRGFGIFVGCKITIGDGQNSSFLRSFF